MSKGSSDGVRFSREHQDIARRAVNLSKSGISTSIGVKGFTYNTRGRITTSIPGTGIYHVTNLRTKGARQPSRRQSASLEFRMCVQERVVCALRGYFLSHGIYVSEANLGQATELVEHDAPASAASEIAAPAAQHDAAEDHHAYYRSDFR
ncbi:hypothetical protein AWB73_03973 [Caballeronia turbans]|nr:hypothetical protein AWB73_03973 [Caballeronia turbans]